MTSGTNHYTNTHLKTPKFLPLKFIVKRRETVSKLRLISEFQANGKHVCVFTVSELSCSHQPVCCGYSRQNAEQWPVREQRGCGGWNNGLKALPRTPALSCVLNPEVLTVYHL